MVEIYPHSGRLDTQKVVPTISKEYSCFSTAFNSPRADLGSVGRGLAGEDPWTECLPEKAVCSCAQAQMGVLGMKVGWSWAVGMQLGDDHGRLSPALAVMSSGTKSMDLSHRFGADLGAAWIWFEWRSWSV